MSSQHRAKQTNTGAITMQATTKKLVDKLETDIIHILKNIDYKEKGKNGVGYDFWNLKEIVTEKFNKLKRL
jgi:NADH/NAD ratio-sensing transcriptional regulator Rex